MFRQRFLQKFLRVSFQEVSDIPLKGLSGCSSRYHPGVPLVIPLKSPPGITQGIAPQIHSRLHPVIHPGVFPGIPSEILSRISPSIPWDSSRCASGSSFRDSCGDSSKISCRNLSSVSRGSSEIPPGMPPGVPPGLLQGFLRKIIQQFPANSYKDSPEIFSRDSSGDSSK